MFLPRPGTDDAALIVRKLELDKQIKEVLKTTKRAKKRTKANEDDVSVLV